MTESSSVHILGIRILDQRVIEITINILPISFVPQSLRLR